MQKKDYEEEGRQLTEAWLQSVGMVLAALVIIALACLFC